MEDLKLLRKHYSIPSDEYQAALEYAEADGRDMSGLICEALRQIRRRYPKVNERRQKERIQVLQEEVTALQEKVSNLYAQVLP